jgi:hypothetical protein
METTTTPRPEEYYGGRLLADCAAHGSGHGPAADWDVSLVARLLAEAPGHRRTAPAAAVGSGQPRRSAARTSGWPTGFPGCWQR